MFPLTGLLPRETVRHLFLVSCIFLAMASTVARATPTDEEAGIEIKTGTTELVSLATNGAPGDRNSGEPCGGVPDGPSISDNGRYVAFTSAAGNLDPSDSNGASISDVFVRDRKTGRTEIVSVSSTGSAPLPAPDLSSAGCFGWSHDPDISANGRFVAFASSAPDLVSLDTNATLLDVFVHDRKKETTEIVSVNSDGDQVTGNSGTNGLSISGDGRYVTFTSTGALSQEAEASDCEVPTALGPCFEQVYVHDRKGETTTLVSLSSGGEPANASSVRPYISDDGRYVAFETEADNLVDSDQNGLKCAGVSVINLINRGLPRCADVYLRDLEARKTELVSVSRQGGSADDVSSLPNFVRGQTVTPGGRFVVFTSRASDLIPDGSTSALISEGVYVRDRKTGRTERVSVTPWGSNLAGGRFASISNDGRYVVFENFARPGEVGCPKSSTGCIGVFVHDRRTGATDFVLIKHPGAGPDSYRTAWGALVEGSGRELVYASRESDSDVWQVFVRDLGSLNLGVGGLLSQRSDEQLLAPGSPNFSRTGIIDHSDSDRDGFPDMGAELIGARFVYRARYEDFYARIDFVRLAGRNWLPVGVDLPIVSGMRFTVDGTRYEWRVQNVGQDRFGLFRCDPVCTEISSLKGGYGTTGEAITTAIPLSQLGLEHGGAITNMEAFTALGSYDLGTSKILDSLSMGDHT